MRERNERPVTMLIKGTDKNTFHSAIGNHVVAGSTIYTDDHRGYAGLGGSVYRHENVKHSAKEYVNEMAHTNGMESVWAVLKRGYNGVYHNWSKKHCRHYVNEFSFCLNDGNVETDTQDRLDALFGTMSGKTITFEALTK